MKYRSIYPWALPFTAGRLYACDTYDWHKARIYSILPAEDGCKNWQPSTQGLSCSLRTDWDCENGMRDRKVSANSKWHSKVKVTEKTPVNFAYYRNLKLKLPQYALKGVTRKTTALKQNYCFASSMYVRTFAPKISHVQIFLKLWLQVENDKIILKT